MISCDITKDYYLTIHATVFDDEKIETLGYTPIDTKDPPKPTERQKITITKESGNIFPQTIQPQIYIDATITLPNDNAEEYKYVKLSIENHESGNYAHIFVSPTEEKPNYANSIDKSLEKSSILNEDDYLKNRYIRALIKTKDEQKAYAIARSKHKH